MGYFSLNPQARNKLLEAKSRGIIGKNLLTKGFFPHPFPKIFVKIFQERLWFDLFLQRPIAVWGISA